MQYFVTEYEFIAKDTFFAAGVCTLTQQLLYN